MNSLNNSKCDSKDSATRKSKNIDKNTIEMSKREKSIKNENALIGHRKQQKQKANPEKNNSTLNIKKKCMVKDFK